jgi:arylsulfatase A-like enzyme
LYLEEFGLAARDAEEPVDNESIDNGGEPVGDGIASSGDQNDTADVAAAAQPDESLDWRYAGAMYAAYVTLLDRWLGRLLAAIDVSPDWSGALLIVTAGSGQTLGEHGTLADERAPLRAECLQTPLWIRVPGSDQAGTRRQDLVQTVDLAPTLLEWFCGPDQSSAPVETPAASARGQSLLPLVRNEFQSYRKMALMGNGRSEWGIRTDDFFYVEAGDGPDESERPTPMLFEKPHDRWDQFDVLSQFPQVTDDLRSALRQQIERLGVCPSH